MGGNRITRLRKRPIAIAAAGALVLGGLVAATTAQAADNIGNYEILAGPNRAAMLDTDPAPVNLTDPEGNSKELGPVNSNDTKLVVIHDAAVPMLADTNPNAQVDLRDIWLGTSTFKKAGDPDDGDQFLYFAWERDSANGSGVLMIEFQKAKLGAECNYAATGVNPATCNPWAGRADGDFVLVWDQQGQNIKIIKRTFHETNGVLTLDAGVTLTSAKAAVSTDGFFGEASINLTNDVFGSVAACTTLANVIPGTVTGNSDTADYKDTVLALAPPISNCGSVKITKKTDPAGEAGTFGWNLARTNSDPIRYAADGYSGDELIRAEGDLVVSESDPEPSTTVDDLIGGTNYTLNEDVPSSPFELQSIKCTPEGGAEVDLTSGGTFTVAVGTTTDCVIVNELKDGTLRVVKQLTNDNGGQLALEDFDFSRNDGSGAVSESFAGTDLNGTDTQDFTYPANTTVDVVETDYSPAYATTYSDDYAGNDPAEGEDPAECRGLVVPADGIVTCTITNDDRPGKLIVKKVVNNNNGGTAKAADFTFKVNGGTSTSFLRDGADEKGKNEITVNAGTYSVVEDSFAGYVASYANSVNANTNCTSLQVPNGGTVTCTITNDDSPEVAKPVLTFQKWVLHDSASIAGLRAGGGAATVTFTLWKDPECKVPWEVDGTAYSEVRTVTPEGGTTVSAATQTGFLATLSGDTNRYYWKAVYSGNQNNSESASECTAEATVISAKDDTPRDDFATP